jgi:hypothetical protein
LCTQCLSVVLAAGQRQNRRHDEHQEAEPEQQDEGLLEAGHRQYLSSATSLKHRAHQAGHVSRASSDHRFEASECFIQTWPRSQQISDLIAPPSCSPA